MWGNTALTGQYSYYVCPSWMKRGKGVCDSPRLNARRFEELVVSKIRSNILTEGSIRDLVKVVDEEMDGVAREQRKRLETIDAELEEVKKKLGRIWHFIETTYTDMADASDRIREHRERQERLEDAAAARAILSQRRKMLDDVNSLAAHAKDMRDFLNESELTERRGLHQVLCQGDRRHARRRPPQIHRSHAGRQLDSGEGRRKGGPPCSRSIYYARWWARQGSNLRPIGYEPTALPLSYGPGVCW